MYFYKTAFLPDVFNEMFSMTNQVLSYNITTDSSTDNTRTGVKNLVPMATHFLPVPPT